MKRPETVEPPRTVGGPVCRPGPYTLSCVVPAFNEAAGLSQFLADLHETTSRLAPRVEIVLVDDGNEDDTPLIAVGLARSRPRRVRNFRTVGCATSRSPAD